MIDRLLTDQELELVIEILEGESRRLAVEARRTDAHGAHEAVRSRERAVDRLIQRFQEVKAGELRSV